MAVQVKRLLEFIAKGLDFMPGLLEASHCAQGPNYYILLANFSPFFGLSIKI